MISYLPVQRPIFNLFQPLLWFSSSNTLREQFLASSTESPGLLLCLVGRGCRTNPSRAQILLLCRVSQEDEKLRANALLPNLTLLAKLTAEQERWAGGFMQLLRRS